MFVYASKKGHIYEETDKNGCINRLEANDTPYFLSFRSRSECWNQKPSCWASAWIIVGVGRTDVVTHVDGLLTRIIATSNDTIETLRILNQEGAVATADHLSLEILSIDLAAESTYYDIVVLEQTGITAINYRYSLLTIASLYDRSGLLWSSLTLRSGVSDWTYLLYFFSWISYHP